MSLLSDVPRVESSIESFIRYLAVERGLSDNYQLSTQRSLTDFARWLAGARKIESFKAVTLPMMSEYLAAKKKAGLSAASIKLILVALKIFFRFLAGKGEIDARGAAATGMTTARMMIALRLARRISVPPVSFAGSSALLRWGTCSRRCVLRNAALW